ncbi:spore germination protein [Haloimpatiens sp. FM7315]|uniref:spore germination protein n=1 Tax=Haloimpatiens sp. FM7315 TaxID=3298609 RepID=UPI0035A373DC
MIKFRKSIFLNKINELSKDNSGISLREVRFKNKKIVIAYIAEITDRNRVSSDIIKPILEYSKVNDNTKQNIKYIANSVIYLDDILIDDDVDKMSEHILKGKSLIIMEGAKGYIVANTYKVEKRSIEGPQLQNVLRGPRDAFTESFDSNLSLIRYRIKDSSLMINKFTIGRRTKTSVGVVYLNDVANSKYVSDIQNKLKNIDVDGIIDAGYIEKFISDKGKKFFPEFGINERPDSVCGDILKGKVCLVVEGSNLVLVAPYTLPDFLDAGDDHYDNTYISVFMKNLRIMALIMSLTLSSLYVAIISYHPDILPPQYILVLAESRVTVPVNALLEVTLMELVTEILKESSLRLPKQVGSAISIVGTIVIGQAAVSAGLTSAATVIVISLTTMTSFISPDYAISQPIRLLKFMLIILTGIFGLFGFVVGITIITINITSKASLGVPYTAPIAPFNFKDLKDYFLSDIALSKKRPEILNDKDKTRQ